MFQVDVDYLKSVDGINLGTIGVIGPTRMDYGKVISALEYVRKRLLSE